MPWLEAYLIPEWRDGHKFWSVRLEVLGTILSGFWLALPAFQEMVPPYEFLAFCMLLAAARLGVRFLKQKDIPSVKS